jgi:hypothetical protein
MQVEGSSPSSNHLAPNAFRQDGPQHLGQKNNKPASAPMAQHVYSSSQTRTKPKNTNAQETMLCLTCCNKLEQIERLDNEPY